MELYTAGTGNGQRAAIAVNECGLTCTMHVLNLAQGDQRAPGTERGAVSGRLIYVRLHKNGLWIHLWLFTSLDAKNYPLSLLVQWYGQRWQAELHFRSVKTQMKMAELDVSTPPMARKEFYAGLLAYNLVQAVMWKAGTRLQAGIKAISFSQARRVLVEQLNHLYFVVIVIVLPSNLVSVHEPVSL